MDSKKIISETITFVVALLGLLVIPLRLGLAVWDFLETASFHTITLCNLYQSICGSSRFPGINYITGQMDFMLVVFGICVPILWITDKI